MLKWLFALPILILLGNTALANSVESTDMPATNLHRIIAHHQQGWLNTSRAITAEDLQGRVILLDFWTFCCINCIHVIPDLHYLEKTFGDKLTVIGVHSAKFENERDSENIRNAILRYDIEHPVVNDFDFSTWRSFGVRAWPTFVLINPKGTIENVYSGEGNREEAESDIRKLLARYDGKLNTTPLPIALEKNKQPPTVLSFPGKLAYGKNAKGEPVLFVADSGHQRIAIMTPEGKIIDQIGSGDTGFADGNFSSAQFNTPQGLLYTDGILYVADTNNHSLRAANLNTRTVTTLAGIGKQGHDRFAINAHAQETPLASPWDLSLYPDANTIVIAMAGTHQLWTYDIADKTVSVLAGNGRESIDDGRYPFNSLSQPSGVASIGNTLYFVDSETSSLRMFKDSQIETLIGTGLFDFGYKEGTRDTALMQHPLGIATTPDTVYIADSYNHSIRSYNPVNRTLSNFAGHGERGNHDGSLQSARFNEPAGIITVGNMLYVADTNNHAIRTINLTNKTVSTLPVVNAITSPARFSITLPNAETLRAGLVIGVNTVQLSLKPEWKINHDAPSYLALFDANKQPITQFDHITLRSANVSLPELSAGTYYLQGTLYYCENKEGSECLVKSIDATLDVTSSGKKEIVVTLD